MADKLLFHRYTQSGAGEQHKKSFAEYIRGIGIGRTAIVDLTVVANDLLFPELEIALRGEIFFVVIRFSNLFEQGIDDIAIFHAVRVEHFVAGFFPGFIAAQCGIPFEVVAVEFELGQEFLSLVHEGS